MWVGRARRRRGVRSGGPACGDGRGRVRAQAEFNALAGELARAYPDRARLWFAYDEPLSHLIYAGADMLLVPSMFEPCGLTQMIAMRRALHPAASTLRASTLRPPPCASLRASPAPLRSSSSPGLHAAGLWRRASRRRAGVSLTPPDKPCGACGPKAARHAFSSCRARPGGTASKACGRMGGRAGRAGLARCRSCAARAA